MSDVMLYEGACLEVMSSLADNSVDMVLADPPYGTTQCKWDSIIDLDGMWAAIDRVAKSHAAIVLNCAQPFTSSLIASNLEMFKYCWYWNKVLPRNHLNAKRMPLRVIEEIAVFYAKQPTYNPQKTKGARKTARSVYKKSGDGSQVYGGENRDTYYDSDERHPHGLITFSTADQRGKLHPTQKPVALMEYLINTYTNEGDTVLDFCMGSGTTGVAAKNLGRNFVGIERDEEYFKIASDRIAS